MKLMSIIYIETTEKPMISLTITIVLKYFDNFSEDVSIIVKFNLPGTIKNDIIILSNKFIEFRLQPILVLQQIFHAVEQSSIGT
jgi:hypothetical protein